MDVRGKSRSKQREKGNAVDKILADLFRQIAHTVTPVLPKLINKYLERRGLYTNVKEMASARGNINKEINAETMTWKVFCRSLEILQIRKMVINLDITWGNGVVVHYKKDVIFSNNEIIGEEIASAEGKGSERTTGDSNQI